jgi:hypothetical protein
MFSCLLKGYRKQWRDPRFQYLPKRGEKQIPFGNDRKKGKGKNSRSRSPTKTRQPDESRRDGLKIAQHSGVNP